ncbi:MAG: TetR family transcriptional regulator, partial [Myxococcota bacterium]
MRYKKSEISSAQIVQAAIRVLARQGYARTSLMDIAREAGMSKGAVH